jgi:hypothetical protein
MTLCLAVRLRAVQIIHGPDRQPPAVSIVWTWTNYTWNFCQSPTTNKYLRELINFIIILRKFATQVLENKKSNICMSYYDCSTSSFIYNIAPKVSSLKICLKLTPQLYSWICEEVWTICCLFPVTFSIMPGCFSVMIHDSSYTRF